MIEMNTKTTKICSGPLCKGRKRAVREFGVNRSAKNGLQGWCRVCVKEYNRSSKGKENSQKYLESSKGKRAKWKCNLKQKYNLFSEEWDIMFQRQEGLCALCEEPLDRAKAHVDHNHETEKVRGLLHPECNVLLGKIEKKPRLLEAIPIYLRRHGTISMMIEQ